MSTLDDMASDDGFVDLDPTVKQSIFCYRAIMTTSSGVWLGDNPLNFSFPLLLYQIVLVFVVSRVTHSILRHLSQPQVISQIIAGILLGPSVMGHSIGFEKLLFSPASWEQLHTLSIFSFMLFLFVIGVKTDLGMIRRAGKKAAAIALIGSLLPCCLCLLTAYLLSDRLPALLREKHFLLSMSTKWNLTSYTVLSCLLSELNLLTSKLGRLAMSASIIADFLNLAVSAVFTAYLLGAKRSSLVLAASSFLSFTAFMGFIVFIARPLTMWIMRKTPEGNLLGEGAFIAVLFLALACGFVSEVIGIHATMGPFMLGLMLPGGAPLGVTLVEKMDRLVTGVFLPLFLAQAGLRLDLTRLGNVVAWGYLELLIFMCIFGKFVGAAGVCLYCKMPLRDAFSLGLIMICKGIYEVDAAVYWKDAQIIDRQMYTILILSIILYGGGTAPLIKHLYRPEDRFVAYKRRTLLHSKPNTELRVIACIHNQDDVNPIITLLGTSHPSPDTPICIYVLHLIQLAGRAATILAPYKRNKNSSSSSSSDAVATDTDHIVNAFQYFERQNPGRITTLPYVGISPFATMHDDICSLALDKKACLVIVPFHKHIAIDGTFESANPAIQSVNINVFRYAPCSVAILIDHGLPGRNLQHVAVYFFGGRDDREALAYGMRMAEDPSTGLTVVRFRPPKEWREGGREEKMDDEIMEEFRTFRVDGSRVVYKEEVVKDGEGTVAVIRAISSEFSLLVVGRRGDGQESPLTAGLSDWNEYPELGTIGDLLASSTDFGSRVSCLVVQQQTRVAAGVQCETPRVTLQRRRVVPTNENWSVATKREDM